ncbi:MAG: hypothetical protein AM326_10190 [Candidatus Thorarchaeota archaeon SMTZ-45]|nr:MAG: hypothetical protein AM325_02955 [Candidatus Thorarchaeota archaeon SMTZ1-45]KXH74029.1 MAG: hypothetical protein AM326_10190 [Candidatus Thorarchaeota archaeon SMTZ-45]
MEVNGLGNWNLRDYIETIKLSVRFTKTYYLSIFLAILGVFVITISLFLLIVFIGTIPISIVYGPFDEIFDAFDYIGVALSGANSVEAVGIVLFVGSALFAPFLIALGALFGIGQEIFESGSTTAEDALLWYRQKFTRLAAGGIVQFLYIIGPIGIEYILTVWYFGNQVVDSTSLMLLIIIAIVWFLISSGMLSMVFPLIVDGMSISASIKHSIRLTWNNLSAVFSIWITFSSLGLLILGPIIAQELADFPIIAEQWYDLYVLTSAVLIFLLLLPVYVLSTSRTYLIISDPNIKEAQEVHTKEVQ